MFRRRARLPLPSRLRGLLWPRAGWRRAATYLAHRVGRLPGGAHAVAAGFASGAAVAMTPFVGFHVLIALALAFCVRGSYLAAAIGTAVANPWTFPFLLGWDLALGRWLLGDAPRPPGGGDVERALPHVGDLMVDVWRLMLGRAGWDTVGPDILRVLWPATLGGLVTMVVLWPVVYLLLARPVAAYQEARRRRVARRRAPATGGGDDRAPYIP